MRKPRALTSLILASLAIACGDDTGSGGSGGAGAGGSGGEGPVEQFSANIVRTSFGVPHVTADDFGSLGYGAGYAYAQDNFCVLMREVIVSNGESARWFGEEEGNLSKDYVFTFFNTDGFIENEFLPGATEDLQALIRGYAAGLNRYLDETGVDNLPEGPEGCRGAPWVRPISNVDLGKVYWKLTVLAGIDSTDPLITAAADVAPSQSLADASLAPFESRGVDWGALGLRPP